MAFVRTFGVLKPTKDVQGVAIKISALSESKVTDIQLNAGSSLFQWSAMVGDLGLKATQSWRFINGMIQADYDTWVIADEDIASPYRGIIYPVGVQNVEWGLMYIGEVSSSEDFNGYEYTLSQGAGVTPHHTARADQRLDLTTNGIMSAITAIKGIHVDPGSPERSDLGTVTEAHADSWSAVWAWHEDWASVLEEHGGW